MAKTRLEIVIEALNLASDELKQVEKELAGIDDAGESGGKSLASMAFSFNNVIQAGRTAAQVLGEVVEVAERGAVFGVMSDQLEMYTGSALMASEVTDRMAEATDGALDRFTAAQTANRFYGMEMANTADEAALLADIAVTLGDRTLTAQQRTENFTLLLANQSKRRLDTYNISIGAVEEEMDRLKSTTEGLTDEQAFLEAVLKVGGTRLAEMEEAGVQAATGYDRVRSALADFNTEAGRSINQIFGPLADGFAGLVKNQADYWRIENDVKEAIREGNFTTEEFNEILRQSRAEVGYAAMLNEAYARSHEIIQERLTRTAQIEAFMSETTVASNEMSAESLAALEEAYAGVAERAQNAVKIFLEFEPSVNTVKQSFGALNTDLIYNQAMTGLSGAATLELARANGQLNETTYSVLAPLEQLNQAQQTGLISAEDYAAAVVEMNRIRMEEGPEAAAMFLENTLKEIEAVETAALKTQGFGLEIAGAGDALENFPDDYTTLEGWQKSFKDAAGSADAAAGKIKAIVDWLEKLPEEKTVHVNIVTHGNVGVLSSGVEVSTGSSGQAAGGYVRGGVPTVIGETGPELFIPASDGQIVNNDQLRRMGGGNVQVTNVFNVWGEELARAVDEGMLRAFMQAGMEVRR